MKTASSLQNGDPHDHSDAGQSSHSPAISFFLRDGVEVPIPLRSLRNGKPGARISNVTSYPVKLNHRSNDGNTTVTGRSDGHGDDKSDLTAPG